MRSVQTIVGTMAKTEKRGIMKALSTRRGGLAACGFGLSKAAIAVGYLTAMGLAQRNVGFVTELWFMFTSEAVSVVLAGCVVAWAARSGRIGMLPQWPAWAAFASGYALGSVGAFSGSTPAFAAVLGALYGVSSSMVSFTWIEEFSRQHSREAPMRMVVGLFIQLVCVAAFAAMPRVTSSALTLALMAASALCWLALRRIPGDTHDEAPWSRIGIREFVRHFADPFICLFVLVGVVGILHTSVLGSSSEHIVGDVSMAMPLGAATLATAAFAVLALHLPNPTTVYKACLPVMLALLSALPFVGSLMGSFVGFAMITCYDVCGMLFLFYIVEVAHAHGRCSYVLTGVYLVGSNLFLSIGLGIGLALGAASADYGMSLLTLLAFAAIYPLGIAFFFIAGRGARKHPRKTEESVGRMPADPDCRFRAPNAESRERDDTGAAGDTDVPSPAGKEARPPDTSDAAQPDWAAALDAFSLRYGLTRREAEVCSYLVRGRSARHIAEELVISENTVWTHAKSVYAKTEVSGKDGLIDLFESEARFDGMA